jgi:hypothetical protein
LRCYSSFIQTLVRGLLGQVPILALFWKLGELEVPLQVRVQTSVLIWERQQVEKFVAQVLTLS